MLCCETRSAMLVVTIILKNTTTVQVLFIVSLFCARNITTVEINSGFYLKVKFVKCLCLLPVVLVLVLRIWSLVTTEQHASKSGWLPATWTVIFGLAVSIAQCGRRVCSLIRDPRDDAGSHDRVDSSSYSTAKGVSTRRLDCRVLCAQHEKPVVSAQKRHQSQTGQLGSCSSSRRRIGRRENAPV